MPDLDTELLEFKDTMKHEARRDPDLIGFLELRVNGYTDAVSSDRADSLFDYDPDQLSSEVRRDYFLTQEDYKEVVDGLITTIHNANLVALGLQDV